MRTTNLKPDRAHQQTSMGIPTTRGTIAAPSPVSPDRRGGDRSSQQTDWFCIVNLFLILFVGYLDSQMIAPLLPQIADALGVSISTAGMLIVSYSVVTGIFALLGGALSDRHGRKGYLTGAVALLAVISFGTYAFAGGFTLLLLSRAAMGIASGTISSTAIAYAGDYFAYHRRGRAFGFIIAANSIALVAGVPLAVYLADRFGWRHVFLATAGLAALATLLSVFTLPALGKSDAPEAVDRFTNHAEALSHIFSRRDTLAALTIAFCVSGGFVGVVTYFAAYLHTRFEVGAQGIGTTFLIAGVFAVSGSIAGGFLSDRIGKKRATLISSALLTLSIVILPGLGWSRAAVAVFGVLNLAAAFRQGALNAMMTEMVSRSGRGTFIALRNIASQAGIAVATFTGAMVFDRHGFPFIAWMCASLTFLVVVLLGLIREPEIPEA
ncbi:MAG: MFS transporter [Acidobacteria bacterium]|nr:MFS transporter [Acidobacteriota bacterium]